MKPLVKQLLQASVVIWNCSLKTSIVYFTFMRALYHSHLDIRCPTERFMKMILLSAGVGVLETMRACGTASSNGPFSVETLQFSGVARS
jgi:hypothetical protein